MGKSLSGLSRSNVILQKCMAYLQNRFYSYGSIHHGADMRFLRQLYDNGFSIFSDNEAQKVFLSFSFFFSVKVVVVGSGFEYPSNSIFSKGCQHRGRGGFLGARHAHQPATKAAASASKRAAWALTLLHAL